MSLPLTIASKEVDTRPDLAAAGVGAGPSAIPGCREAFSFPTSCSMKWISRRMRMKYCVAEYARGDLRLQAFRVPTPETKAKSWVKWLVMSGYEFELTFARRKGGGKEWSQFKDIVTLRYTDMPKLIELYELAHSDLRKLDHQRTGNKPVTQSPAPAELLRDVPAVKVTHSSFETVALAYRDIGILDIVVHRDGHEQRYVSIPRREFLSLSLGFVKAWLYTRNV